MIKEIYIHTMEELYPLLTEQTYRSDIDRNRNLYVYRGMTRSYYDIVTSLDRNCKDKKAILEPSILRNFTKYAALEDPSIKDSIWRQMILGQHHGLPTRLLDWSRSPLIALHFAVTERKMDNINKYDYYFTLSLLDHCYWITGAALGGIFGSLIPFSLSGLDFMMTAMFVVIFLDSWLRERSHLSSLIGFGSSFFCLLLFGADGFIIPSMCVILCFLLLFRRTITEKGGFR